MVHDAVAIAEIREYTLSPCLEDLRLTAHFRSLSACIFAPEKEREEVSLCSKDYILLPARTLTAAVP
jgi:hypothetical protein